jgi:hypothetical protein
MDLLLVGSRHKWEIRLAARLFNKSAGLFNNTARKFKKPQHYVPILFVRSLRAHCWEGKIMSNTAAVSKNIQIGSRGMTTALAVSLLVLISGVATSLLSAFHVVG